MLTISQIEKLAVGESLTETLADGTITVRRKPDTKTGKPQYHVFATRARCVGGQGARSAQATLKLIAWYSAYKGSR